MKKRRVQGDVGDAGRDSSDAGRDIGRPLRALKEGVEVFADPQNVVCIDLQSGEMAPMGAMMGSGSGEAVVNRGVESSPEWVPGKRLSSDIETVIVEEDQGKRIGVERKVVESLEPSTYATAATLQTPSVPAEVRDNSTNIGEESDILHETTLAAQPPQAMTSFTPTPASVDDIGGERLQSAIARPAPVIFNIPEDDSRSVREALQQAAMATRALSAASAPPQQSATGGGDRDQQRSVPHKPALFKRRDPETMHKAAQLGLNLERFEEKGIEDQALQELSAMLKNSRSEGFLSIIRSYAVNSTALEAANFADAGRDDARAGAAASGAEGVDDRVVAADEGALLSGLFRSGEQQSALSLQEILIRPTAGETAAQLRQPTPQLPMYLPGNEDGSSAAAGELLDIFQSPSELYGQIGTQLPNSEQRRADTSISENGGGESYNPDPQAPPDPKTFALDQQRLYVLLTELNRTAAELQDGVIDGYRDLLLSENMLFLLKRANITTFDYNQRIFYQKITEKTIALTTELGALVKTESVRHLQTIQDVCEIAADFQHDEEKFLTRMQYIKPRFDTAFLAYLTYAMGEETTRMRQAGVDPTAAPSDWLKVLLVVKQGVVAEFEARYRQLLEPLLLVARFDAGPLRSDIFKRFVAITPAMELPYLKALALNMIEGILAQDDGAEPGLTHTAVNTPPYEAHSMSNAPAAGTSAQNVFAYSSAQRSVTPLPDPRLAPRMRSLRVDVDTLLSDDVIRARIATFREEVRAQGQEIVVRHRNPVMQDEMETHRELTQQQMRGGLGLPGFE
jgi:hypothetical protein